ncbi:hypothetical protein D3C80_1617680 [compost metagenome]
MRALGNDPGRLTETRLHTLGEQFPQPQGAGVHHRRQHLLTPLPGQFAQHLQAGKRAVRRIAVEAPLQGRRASGEWAGDVTVPSQQDR